ncbi:hypothetical protein K7B10_35200 [Streptomyces flavotricini]|uniref:Uncharacterized protein n=1 Tax=Streptomyces flavotricini TaxID=66888 RepID=A0ABS8EFK4_9ACTN|nr:hypothetical protein [Streptomyces flavotricini]MCC0099940.1 hypothetical protein [Streptomyces flavotricini]
MESSSASHPASYTVVLRPALAEPGDSARRGVLRTALVEATGEFGASGYPRYAGEGVQADIDPRTRTVEAVTLDGAELPYGWVAQLADG